MSRKKENKGVQTPCPEGRISHSTMVQDGVEILDIENYIPYFLVSVNNALSRGASQFYLKNFGIGLVEWRVMAMLAIEPKIPASRVCEVVSLDKAATSRALSKLLEARLVVQTGSKDDSRKKFWRLNRKGYGLHQKVLKIALERENQLVQGVDPEDLEAFLRVMRMMRRNVREM